MQAHVLFIDDDHIFWQTIFSERLEYFHGGSVAVIAVWDCDELVQVTLRPHVSPRRRFKEEDPADRIIQDLEKARDEY